MIEDCTAIILAGGESQRMGCDKATLVLGEHSLLQRVIANVQPIFPQVLVSVRRHRPDIDLRQICDTQADAGPLAGLCAGLEQSTTPWVFAVATDMPFVQAALTSGATTLWESRLSGRGSSRRRPSATAGGVLRGQRAGGDSGPARW
jgi:molybdopterin-guanine dinucleotide biosynthesis protein A